jgi:hypothetical protein
MGRLWSHRGLNEATHDNLNSFIGGVSMTNLRHLMFMGSHSYVVDDASRSILTDENIERLRNIPIFFIHGGHNTVYSPESTLKDYDLLRDKFGASQYERWVFEDKGHLDCWMGKGSFIDLYPRVEQHASKTMGA